MGQDRLSIEEMGELLYQRVHVVTNTQELRHSTRNFMRMTGGYLGNEGTLSCAMAIWSCNIDLFEMQYNKAFAGSPFFGADIV